jgi:diguanylate cyclase (GGDEF)-like protein/PAS domain S-box-containing protein
MTIWNNLLGNLAVVAICTSLWTFSNGRFARLDKDASSLALGIIMAVGTACVMMLPFEFMTGIFLDLRYTFIGISAFFGGPLAVVFPVIVGILMRMSLGGTGVSLGITHILLSATSCLILWRVAGAKPISIKVLSTVAAAVSLSGTIGFFFVVPTARWSIVFPTVVAPFTSALFVSTATAGLAILQERRRLVITNENRIYRAIIEALPDCLNAKDLAGRFVAANPATANLMKAPTAASLLGKTDTDFYPADIAASFRGVELELIRRGKPLTVEQKFTRVDGNETWLATLKAPIFDEQGSVIGVVTHNREITQQKHMELELATAQAQLQDAVSSMADGLAMFDGRGILRFRNARYLELFPLTADIRDVGSSLKDVLRLAIERGEDHAVSGCPDNTVERTYAALMAAGTRQFRLADGRWIEARTRQGTSGGAMIVFTDITAAKQAEVNLQTLNNQLTELATTDALTGLSNRRAFDKAIDDLTRHAEQTGEDLALLMIDVDRFKSYNDTYGHPAGDVCLQAISQALTQVAARHPEAVVARYGGEEIAVILPCIQEAEASQMASRLCEVVRSRALPHSGSEKGIVTVSIGVAMHSRRGGRRREDLVKDADMALYDAKALGRDQVRLAEQPQAKSRSMRH